MANLKLVLSTESFTEIAGALERHGIKIGEGNINAATKIEIEKGTQIIQPFDWPQVKLRKDCLTEATRLVRGEDGGNGITIYEISQFIELVNKLYNYVLKGEIPEPIKPISVSSEIKTTDKLEGWK